MNFTLLSGALLEWQRELAFANGELRRSVLWRSPDGKRYRLESRRFVSLAQLPLVAMQLAITPLDGPSQVVLKPESMRRKPTPAGSIWMRFQSGYSTRTVCRACMKRRTGFLMSLYPRSAGFQRVAKAALPLKIVASVRITT